MCIFSQAEKGSPIKSEMNEKLLIEIRPCLNSGIFLFHENVVFESQICTQSHQSVKIEDGKSSTMFW